MKKSNVINFSIGIFGICFYILGYKLMVYLNSGNFKYEFLPIIVFLHLSLPIFFGAIISLPFKQSASESKLTIDWSKLLFQGTPAFFLALPYSGLLFSFMKLVGIHSLNLGIFNGLFSFMPQIEIFYSLSGVWLGKVLVESIVLSKKLDVNDNISM